MNLREAEGLTDARAAGPHCSRRRLGAGRLNVVQARREQSVSAGEDAMAHETIEIAYGRGALPVSLPPGAEPTVIRKAVLPKLPDGPAAIRHAFDHPIGSRALRQLAEGRRSAC